MAVYRDPTAVFAQRLGAFLIDLALVIAVFFVAQTYAFNNGEQFSGRPSSCDAAGSICVNSGSDTYLLTDGDASTYKYILMGAVVLALLNYVILQGLTGATVGKFALGIRTINGKDEPCGIGRAFLRTLFSPIDFLCSGLVGIVAYLRSKNHRRVADMIGGTTVVRKDFLIQRQMAAESGAAAAAAAAASATPRGGFANQEPYPGAYGGATGAPLAGHGAGSPAMPPGPTIPAAPPGAPPGFAGSPATPPNLPPGFTAPAAWPPRPAQPPAHQDPPAEPTPDN